MSNRGLDVILCYQPCSICGGHLIILGPVSGPAVGGGGVQVHHVFFRKAILRRRSRASLQAGRMTPTWRWRGGRRLPVISYRPAGRRVQAVVDAQVDALDRHGLSSFVCSRRALTCQTSLATAPEIVAPW